MSSTRPIPIGTSGSQRGSPGTLSPSPHAIVSHSLPADMHHVHLSRFRTSPDRARSGGVQPPRAPLVGSMPEPSLLSFETMPDLALGPPAERLAADSPPVRTPAVLQFASSCPGDFGFLQRNPTRGSWTPTLEPYLAEQDDFDLSKSPAFAAMSAVRDRMARDGKEDRRIPQVDGTTAYRSVPTRGALGPQPSRHYYASDESSRHAVSAELLERLSITSEEGEAGEREERYQTPGFLSHMPVEQTRRTTRRGSSGNGSESGDTGIFEFDDQ